MSAKDKIICSKLFLASSRKSKILSALDNPINIELVKQLNEYLDDEYKEAMQVSNSNDDSDANDISDKFDEAESKQTADRASTSSGGSRVSFTPNKSLVEQQTEVNDFLGDETLDDAELPQDDAEVVVTQAVKVKNKYVSADTSCISTTNIGLENISELIKGTLNAKEVTNGVVRVNLKNDELWVYYNDETNLNTIMGEVIDYLIASGYYYLIFNRLARSDNAMVFTISDNDTANGGEGVE